MAWRHQGLTSTIIGTYYDVYNGTGRAYPEFIYEGAMAADLCRRGVPCVRQREYPIVYKEKLVGRQRLDLLVGHEVVVELKVVPKLERRHKAQLISYLKAAGKDVGLLVNFGGATPQLSRLYRPSKEWEYRAAKMGPGPGEGMADLFAPELTREVIGGLYEVHGILGPGFVHRIYANAVYHELQLRGLAVVARRAYSVIYRGRPVGQIKFGHLEVERSALVFPVAIEDLSRLSIENLKAWMAVLGIPVGILANFWPTRLELLGLRGEGIRTRSAGRKDPLSEERRRAR
jgi:GxxExxY protein